MNDIASQNRLRIAEHRLQGVQKVHEITPAQTVVTSMADFNQRAGITPQQHTNQPARMPHSRLSTAARGNARLPSTNSANGRRIDRSSPVFAKAAELVQALSQGGGVDFDDLESRYDALALHTLLRSAQTLIEESDIDPAEKEQLKAHLDGMQSRLMSEHGDAIRTGLQDAETFENSLNAMDTLAQRAAQSHDPNALRDLRSQYGAKGNSKLETPFTPLALAKTLQEKFGSENFSVALANMRTAFSSDMRSRSDNGMSARMWLSLSDVACFNAIQSCYAIAGELRRDLVKRTQIAPKDTQAFTTVALLRVCEPGGAKADVLAGQIFDRKGLDALEQSLAYMLIRQAVSRLALTMWAPDQLVQRLQLLDELRALMRGAQSNLDKSYLPEEQLERSLRKAVDPAEKQDRDSRGGGGGSGSRNQDDESNDNQEADTEE